MSDRYRFWALVLYLGAAQAAVNIPVWFASGQTLSSHVYLAMISAFSVLVFAILANVGHVGARASSYVQFLLGEFLFTVGVAVIFIVISPASVPGAGLAVSLTAAAALFAVAATYDLPARSYLLDFASRRIFRQSLSPGFGLPDGDFGEADIQRAVPRLYPPAATGGDEPRSRSEPSQRDERDDPRFDGLTEDLARATAWAEELLVAASAAGPARGMPTPVTTSVGFVQSRDEGAKLAVIHYFRPGQLFKALRTMPKSIPFAGRSFLMVARPWQPVEHSNSSPPPPGDPRGSDGHCWVTFGKDGERYGVVTARHVIIPEDAAIESNVSADISRTGTAGILRKRSIIMDAALIDLSDDPEPDLTHAPHSKVPGYKPVRLCTGREPRDGTVTEMFGFIRGEFTKNPEGEPEMRAIMALNVAGREGDSGCLVLDREFEDGGTVAPYLMYLGVIQLADRQAGRGLFLDQVAYHWQVDFQFRVPPLPRLNALAAGTAVGPVAPAPRSDDRSMARIPAKDTGTTVHIRQREAGR